MEVAKNSFPMMKTGGGVLSKLVWMLIVVAMLTFMVKNPTEAAHLVTEALTFLGNAVASLVSILQQIGH